MNRTSGIRMALRLSKETQKTDMKRIALLFLLLVTAFRTAHADEGMWLMTQLKSLSKDMKAKGFKLTADDISSINKLALKDAVVIFGNGCTGEIVSSEGLLLTNHHCGYEAIQQHSSVEHDYLKDGFWAMSRAEEIPTPGLTATFIRRIEDVTQHVIPYLNDAMDERTRARAVDSLTRALLSSVVLEQGQSASVRPMFAGNQYVMFVTEVYNDVRLVGAPPSSIGKFGGDTDNWMWPRHTGDFSVFRVYSDQSGKGAEYSKDNVPYNTPKHLSISLKGITPGDFAMIIGFPGSTQRYMTSYEIDRTLNLDNPVRIFIRGERQEILLADMKASDKIRIQYASKYAMSSNYWKNSIGMSRGLKKLNVRAKKAAFEEKLTSWINADPARKAKYGDALPLIRQSVEESLHDRGVTQYLSEALMRGVELVGMCAPMRGLAAGQGPISNEIIAQLRANTDEIYKDYSPSTDRKVAYRMVQIIVDSLDKGDYPSFVKTISSRFADNVKAYVDDVFDRSVMASQEKFEAFLANPSRETLQKDPGLELAASVAAALESRAPALQRSQAKYARGQRLFIAAQMEMQPDRMFYPDANFTMRMTYGQVLPYRPADGVVYDYYTTLSGVIAKEDPENAYEFSVPEKLKQLYAAKDFGPYACKGDVPVAFLSNNDITGGNSGSPVMDGRGHLIGLAFDGNWEAMSGDIAFEPELQRTISVDIRYVLFVIDKFAGAGHLIKEMTIVK